MLQAQVIFVWQAVTRDSAGNTSTVVTSEPFNTGNWSVYAGSKNRGDGGTGRAASIYGSGLYSQFAINPKNGEY